MKEYIDRERLKEAFHADLQTLQSLDEHTMNLILMEIDEAPAADVSEVVRCWECIYAQEKYGHIECLSGISYRNTYNDPDMFCSYGQRRESEK